MSSPQQLSNPQPPLLSHRYPTRSKSHLSIPDTIEELARAPSSVSRIPVLVSPTYQVPNLARLLSTTPHPTHSLPIISQSPTTSTHKYYYCYFNCYYEFCQSRNRFVFSSLPTPPLVFVPMPTLVPCANE